MKMQAIEKFDVMDAQELAAVEGGKWGPQCWGAGATSLASGAAALGALSTGVGAPLGLYLGTQALGTAATVASCL